MLVEHGPDRIQSRSIASAPGGFLEEEKTMGLSQAKQLRQLLAAPGVLSMPSVYDAMSAKLVERAG